jgi:hypothetical protein
MKANLYVQALLAGNDYDDVLVLMDIETVEKNDKLYTFGYTEAGDKYGFKRDDFKKAIDAGVITADDKAGTVTLPKTELQTFDSGLSLIKSIQGESTWNLFDK